MSKLGLALTADNTNGWFGYGKGVGHMIMSSVITPGGDHVGGNAETVRIVCAEGKTLETSRMVEKFISDAKCKRCVKWMESTGFTDAVASALEAATRQENGPSVVDMIMSGPDAVLITLDTAIQEAEQEPQESKTAKLHREAVKAAKEKKAFKAAVAAKEPKPVRCKDAPAHDNGDGSGVCRACSWHGPLKEDADGNMIMTAHWSGGRTPKSVTLTERKVGPDAPLSESPATTDKGNRSADDMIGGAGAAGAVAGMLPGRTSLTRGADMTGAVPRERKINKKTGESMPAPTTLDVKLGREQIDALADTTKMVVVTESGVKIVSAMVGGERGYLTQEEYALLGATQRRQYWRNVKKAKDQAKAAAQLRQDRKTDDRSRAERMTGKRK